MTTERPIIHALTVKQPWAHLIIHGLQPVRRHVVFKDVENRTWKPTTDGRIWIHAGKGFDPHADRITCHMGNGLPAYDDLTFGGIIGSVEIVDCVTESDSPWFLGPKVGGKKNYGWVLANPERCDFRPMRGQLGLWRVEQ